ncbi:metal ABC transporter ATP-binding protein [Microbacterium invictum]|uniref:ATP-binding cassette domain-containing protein n=1 Tax=Microbacterium invictum TaxID=515415 RepID=A0ABZ0V9K1_9MICO|nr:ATP-binding cassette domain-containing protein [Microbacterium invictum]WQB70285.1 ATP-binding cassette domain-containing protein [Microbacterium invictum]
MRTTETGAPGDAAGRPYAAARLDRVGVVFGRRAVLADVSVQISGGELTVITGPNGAGKSTLLEVLSGARSPSVGVRQVPGCAVLAYMPQSVAVTPLLPITVAETVALGLRRGTSRVQRRRAVTDALRRLDIEALARAPLAEVSGGQRQRALLAQALVRRPGMMLLDEPTTGLDTASATRIRQILREESLRGAAVVCVSHDPAVRGLADRIVGLRDGQVSVDY